MICPRTKGNCACNSALDCVLAPAPVECSNFNLFTSPPAKPSMAEIERLVDALVDAALYSDIQDTQAARAALLAAIRAVLK